MKKTALVIQIISIPKNMHSLSVLRGLRSVLLLKYFQFLIMLPVPIQCPCSLLCQGEHNMKRKHLTGIVKFSLLIKNISIFHTFCFFTCFTENLKSLLHDLLVFRAALCIAFQQKLQMLSKTAKTRILELFHRMN